MNSTMRRFSMMLIAVAMILAAPALSLERGKHEVDVEIGAKAKMRDGVVLSADIYRPRAKGTFPVLLQRTPYDRRGARGSGPTLASHGYVVVIQDVRGRYGSEGDWYPFRHETDDGYDTVEWAAALPGSNGKVGTFGGSYVGATQMLAAIGTPPHLEAIFPYVTAAEYYDGWTYQSGVLNQWFVQSWTSGLALDTLQRKARSYPFEWKNELGNYPVLQAPKENWELAPYYRDWLNNTRDNEYWKPWKISDHYSKLGMKALHSGGWHDIFLKGSIKNYEGMRASAKTAEARDAQRLLVGPWAHTGTSEEGKIGGVVFGKDAVIDMNAALIEWSEWALKDAKNGYSKQPPVKLFIMGENVWRYENEFPLERQQLTRYYLHSQEGANTVGGDGSLSTAKPGDEPADRYTYDPFHPVPTIGGRLCCGNEALQPGPFDQGPNEFRPDVLVYSTPPLERDTEVTGWIKLELHSATSASGADYTALLADVAPDGYARFLTDGIIRIDSRREATGLREIDMWATSNLFKKGHRIRLYVSSSNFPRFAKQAQRGEQRVFHDAERPSALVLPIIPR
jgi:uncharacterized protein